jgi:hypothetical protein
MTAAERRERARLRSERWRRAHGIMSRRPAQKPWLAEGISRSTWYRRGNRILAKHGEIGGGHSRGDNVTSARGTSRSYLLRRLACDRPDLSRAAAFVRQLQAELAEVAQCQAVMAAIIGELSQ